MSLMTQPPDHDMQRLLDEGPFLRDLARQLVVDDADELVQQTWLQALQQGGADIGQPRSWLARIARNVARNLRRGDRRRRDRERSAAMHELVPSSAELMQREERRRTLVAAIDALPPRLRTVVLLRWFDGWPPRRIARELGVPAATVSTQLQRALKLLRSRLDAKHSSRRAWLLPLVPLALPPAGVPRTVLPGGRGLPMVTGVIAMMTKTKLAVAVATVLAVAGAWLMWPDGGFPGSPHMEQEVRGGAQPIQVELTQSTGTDARGDPAPERRVVPPPAAPTTGALLVRVRYGDDHAPARDRLLILRRPGDDPRYDALRQRTDGDGVARFEDLQPGRAYVATNSELGETVEIAVGETAEVDYVLDVGLTLNGIVVDDAGVPVAGALVEVAPMARADAFPEVVTTTGADGRFTARSSPPTCLVGARAAGFRASPVRFLHGKDGNMGEVRLVLGPDGGSVEGTVVDTQGRPVAGAVVIVGEGELSGIPGRDHIPPFAGLVRTDDDGRFEAVGITPGAQPVQVRAVGLAPWQGRVEVVGSRTVPLGIELGPGASVRGRVRNAEGAPVANAEVELGGWRDLAHYRTLTTADGAFELTGLPAGEIELQAAHDDFGAAVRTVRTAAGNTIECDLQLSRGIELVGRVLTENGQPLAGALITCVAENGDWFAFVPSDAEGWFAAANCPENGTIRVEVRSLGIEDLLRRGVDPRAGDLVLHVKTALPRSVRIIGTVLGPDGEPVANASVSGSRQGALGGSGIEATDDAGRFEIGPLTPGAWQIYVRSRAHPDFRSELHNLIVDEVWDLGTIRLPLGGTAVVQQHGEVAGARFYVSNVATTRSWPVDEVGDQLRSSVLAPGDYLLQVSGTGVAAQSVPFAIQASRETTVAVHLAKGTAQHFEIVLPAGDADLLGVPLIVKRGGVRVGRAWASVQPGQPVTADIWLSPGNFEVVAESGDLRGSARFTVGSAADAIVRVVLR